MTIRIVPIDRVREEVLTAIHGGADLDTAVHAAAVSLGLSIDDVKQACRPMTFVTNDGPGDLYVLFQSRGEVHRVPAGESAALR